jgi:hypothetical protein
MPQSTIQNCFYDDTLFRVVFTKVELGIVPDYKNAYEINTSCIQNMITAYKVTGEICSWHRANDK